MKKRATFEESLDATLERFLANRNKLIHHFDEIPGHLLSSISEINSVNDFLSQLGKDTEAVMIFCTALLHTWTEQTGIARGTLDKHSSAETHYMIKQAKTVSSQMEAYIFKKGEK